MTTNYPTGLDTFTTPSASATLGGSTPTHTQLHTNEGDAIEALQAKVGITGSAVTTSLDYRVATLESETVSTGRIVLSPSNASAAGTAINAAIAALPSNGGTIVIPGGTWTIDTAILINKSGITFQGIGPVETLLQFDGSTVPTMMKMADTTQRVVAVKDLRVQSSTLNTGVAFDATYFTNSIFENIRMGSSSNAPNQGIIFNAAGSYYNVIRDCRLQVGGTGSVGISFDNVSNSNVVENTRVIGDSANTIGVYVNSHSIQLNHIDIENNCVVAVDVATSGHDCTILGPYLDTVQGIGVRVASGVESCTILGGFIADSTTADIQNNGADSLAVINTRVNFVAQTYLAGSGGILGVGGSGTSGTKLTLVQGDDTHVGLYCQANSGSASDMIQLKDSGGNLRFQVTGAGATTVRGTAFFNGGGVQIGSVSTDFGGGAGVVSIKNAGTAPTTNPTSGNILYVNSNSHLAVRRPSGSLLTVGGRVASTTATTTVANSNTLTALQAYTVPANDVVIGQEYEVTGWGTYSVTGTPTLTFALYFGGTAGTAIASVPAITAASGVTNAPFSYRARVVFRTTTSCSAVVELRLSDPSTNQATTYVSTPTAVTTGLTTTADADLTMGFTWSAASASNTISLLGGDVRAVV